MMDELPSALTIEVERTANNARILEIIGGFFTIFGTGWLYAGNYKIGIVALFLSVFVVFPIEAILVSMSFGICLCPIPFINIALGFLSGNNAQAWALTNRRTHGSLLPVILGVIIVIVLNIFVFMFGIAFIIAIGEGVFSG